MRADLVIVADRGAVKACEVQQTSTSDATLRVVADLRIDEGHRRLTDVYADQAGSFPNGGSNGNGNSVAERMGAEAEQEMKSFRAVARDIIGILETHKPVRWVFAAPSEINASILDGLRPALKESLVQNLRRDLTNTPPGELAAHFEKAAAL